MRVLFIYPNLKGNDVSIGIGILSAVLKDNDHKVKAIHINESLGIPFDLELIQKEIMAFDPSLICFSANTNHFPMAVQISDFIKTQIKNNIPIVFGGVHVTLNPEDSLLCNGIDKIVIGEGEGALLELADRLEKNKKISDIRNLWLKRDGKIIKNPLRDFISLNNVPFMDIRIWDYQRVIDAKKGWINVSLSRGCPYSCTFCFNESYRKIYLKYGEKEKVIKNYIRVGDYSKTIDGIKDILNHYQGIQCISYVDDDILLYPSTLEFFRMYKDGIDKLFAINARLTSIDEEKLQVLKDCGCDFIRVGIESGNEKIRGLILNRYMSNDLISEKIKLIKKYHIRVGTYNIIGIPMETRENIMETLKLNAKVQTDVMKLTTLYPYKGTKIYEKCRQLVMIPDNLDRDIFTYYEDTILNFDDDFKLFMEKVKKHVDCYLNYYTDEISSMYKPLIDKIEKLSKEEFDDHRVQKEIKNDIDRISDDLSSKKINHYEIRFTDYFAVRV